MIGTGKCWNGNIRMKCKWNWNLEWKYQNGKVNWNTIKLDIEAYIIIKMLDKGGYYKPLGKASEEVLWLCTY